MNATLKSYKFIFRLGFYIMTSLEYFWEFFINFMETLFFPIFMDDKLPSKAYFSPKASLIFKLSYVVIDSIRTSIFNYYNVSYEINYVVGLCSFFAFSFFFYNAALAQKLLFSSAYMAILLASDAIASFPTFFNTSMNDILIGGYLRIPITLTYIICIAVLVFISHFLKWSTFSASPVENLFYIFICILGFYSNQYLSSLSMYSVYQFHDRAFSDKLCLISDIYSFLLLLLLAYIYKLHCSKAVNQKLNDEKKQFLLEESNYKNLVSFTESLREIKHDMQHHLSMIQMLASESNNSPLNDYVNKYLGSLKNNHCIISTGNTPIDCILSTNITKARSTGIDVDYALTVPKNFCLDPILTASLLGNLWSNAIEGCKTALYNPTNGYAYIRFVIKPVQDMLLISIENNFSGKIQKDSKGRYLSSKRINSPGIGLKRIQEIVEQNDGIIEITNSSSTFSVNIMFSLEENA